MRTGYYHDGEIICATCADSIKWRCHACGRYMRSPEHRAGWHDCDRTGPDGSPGHAIPVHAMTCYLQCNETDRVSDVPQNCAWCNAPIDTTLTDDGTAYVLESIREQLKTPIAERNAIATHWPRDSYYAGSRHCDVVLDWADMLFDLDERNQKMVDWFVYLSTWGKTS